MGRSAQVASDSSLQMSMIAPPSASLDRENIGVVDERPASEQELLDLVFEYALDALESDGSPDLAKFLGPRSDLLGRAEALVAVAREVAVVGRAKHELPRVPGYELIRELGRGAAGVVYLARQVELGGRVVALKVLTWGFNRPLPGALAEAASQRALARFASEVNAVARMRHPNIVPVHHVVREGGVFAYAMEAVDGSTAQALVDYLAGLGRAPTGDDVNQFLGSGPLVTGRQPYWASAARLGLGVARALQAVHNEGLLHRDIKPSNILLRRDGTPLLSDFGLVRDAETDVVGEVQGFVGTSAYAAPEQLSGSCEAGGVPGDVYALGATLYHLLALRRPFAGGTPAQVLEAMTEGPAPLRRPGAPGTPRDLETVVLKAMAPLVRDRYQTAADLAADLERVLASRPIEASRPGPIRRAAMLVRRHRQVAWGACAGAVGVALSGAALVLGLVVLPARSKQARTEAWVTLLDPRDTVTLANAGFFEHVETGPPKVCGEVLDHAIEAYKRAVQFGMATREARIELDALRAMRCWRDEGRVEVSERLSKLAPRACAWLAAWCLSGPESPSPRFDAATLSDDDLVAIGLMSYVTSSAMDAVRAWTELERRGRGEGYTRAGLGLYYLYALRPDAAYPRIREADGLLPGVAFLRAAHAECAILAGETDWGSRLLNDSAEMPLRDEAQMFRVGLLLAAARGDEDRVVNIFDSMKVDGSIVVTQIGPWLSARGHTKLAAMSIAHNAVPESGPHIARATVRASEQWWSELTPDQKMAAVREALLSRPFEDGWSTYDVFEAYPRAKAMVRGRAELLDVRDTGLGDPTELEGVCTRLVPHLPHLRPGLSPGDPALELLIEAALGYGE